jgi:hypothetical protein
MGGKSEGATEKETAPPRGKRAAEINAELKACSTDLTKLAHQTLAAEGFRPLSGLHFRTRSISLPFSEVANRLPNVVVGRQIAAHAYCNARLFYLSPRCFSHRDRFQLTS